MRSPSPDGPTGPGLHVLMGVCASSAAIAAPQAVVFLRAHPLVDEVTVMMTPSAASLVGTQALSVANQAEPIVGWGHHPLHVDIGASIDVAVVAPTTATSLARLAIGDAANVLLATLLATPAPVHLYPSMNSTMWAKPAVQRNVAQLTADGLTVVSPAEGVRIGAPGSNTTEVGSAHLSISALHSILTDLSNRRATRSPDR